MDKRLLIGLGIIVIVCFIFNLKEDTLYNHFLVDNMHNIIKYNMINKLDNPKYTKFVDKILFKNYCKEKGINTFKTLMVYDQNNYKNIDLKKLPEKFIVKSNKGCGRNFIVNNKNRRNKLQKMIESNNSELSRWGNIYSNDEPQYEYTKPKIFIEELIESNLEDIKVFVYNKKIELIKTVSENNFKNIYNNKGVLLPLIDPRNNKNYKNSKIDEIKNDNNMNELNKIVNILSDDKDLDIDLFRIDLYYIDKKFYGGEITLSPSGGNKTIIKNEKIYKKESIYNKKLEILLEELYNLAKEYQKNIEGNVFNGYGKVNQLKNIIKDSHNYLEVGFNAGHSCLVALHSNPKIKNVLIFDINHHKYTEPCFNRLKSWFKHINFIFIKGDSTKTIPNYNNYNIKYDFIHIDGGHSKYIAKSDIINCRKLSSFNHKLLIDDCSIVKTKRCILGVCDAVKECIKEDIIKILNLPDNSVNHLLAEYK